MSSPPPRSVFVGVTGASGAPYAVRLLQELRQADCVVQLCISDSGILVLRHELSLEAAGREAVTAAFLAHVAVDVTVYRPDDLAAPPASGSSFPDAVVLCPCSMATVAHVALGATGNLIHRVGDVAIKERRPLVVVPRETPLSVIHLRRMLELAEAGASIVPAMPAFYSRPRTLEDAVDHVIGKVLSVLGFAQELFPPWQGGQS
jgi:flavin prenyltransferase